MAVLLVIGHIEFESGGLDATPRRDGLRRRFLLREHRLEFQPTKLHVGSDTKETAGTLYERVVRWERHITGLYQFDDLILLALIFQFEVLRVEVEGGVGVVVQVHVHLVAHPSVHVQVDLLVEVEGCSLAVAHGQRGVVYLLDVAAHLQLSRSLGLDTHTTRTEYLLCRP